MSEILQLENDNDFFEESIFDCWEGYFTPNRKKCLKCAEYQSCVYQEIFDMNYHRKELKEKKEWNKEKYDLLLSLHFCLKNKESFEDTLEQLKKFEVTVK